MSTIVVYKTKYGGTKKYAEWIAKEIGCPIVDAKKITIAHRTALKTLKKIMQGKENPSDMEKLLIELCDADGDFCDKETIGELIEYVK